MLKKIKYYNTFTGNIYNGEWSNDKKNGRGVYDYKTTGEKYDGEVILNI